MKFKFTFCVLAYNHSEYIIEHLESIKHQVCEYGKEFHCSLIINDDASRDDTVKKISDWLNLNGDIFHCVKKIFSQANLGTCRSVANIISELEGDFCKITAGDDIYTFHDIFEFVSENRDFSIISGVPVRVVDGIVRLSFFEVFNYFASDVIYRSKPLLARLSNVSIINAPNIFYSVKYLKNTDLKNFLTKFDVVEDLPLQVGIASIDPVSVLVSTKVPIVLYRRTSGSTYLVASKRFAADQIKMFDHLIELYKKRDDYLQVVLLKNRKYLFLKKSAPLKLIFNLSNYIYLVRLLLSFPIIINNYFKFKPDISGLQTHFDSNRSVSEKFRVGFDV